MTSAAPMTPQTAHEAPALMRSAAENHAKPALVALAAMPLPTESGIRGRRPM
jgi:hypothetical protein